jgi:hypothetical protein
MIEKATRITLSAQNEKEVAKFSLPNFPKSKRLIFDSKHGHGLGKKCHLCQVVVSEFPYFSHYLARTRTHYYHFNCAKKIDFI